LIDTAGLVMDTLKSPVGISEDIGYMNIISTIYALTAMPSGTTDPLNTDSIAALPDSAKLKLLITAMVDLSLAHNSPQPDENEQSQGIFTNYMQFMDNVVGKWTTIGAGVNGIIRLRNIHNAILEQNRVEIIDPVEVINRGTCFDGNKNAKRKNYAFYEGYSRINWEVEKPDYSGKRSGTGVMFRVSQNIELYGAKLGKEVAVFDTVPFLTGRDGTRIILRSDGPLLSRITSNSSGCWLKGIPEAGKERFEIGISPVRLTVNKLTTTPVKTDVPFPLAKEEKRSSDIEGKIIDGGERSILKVYALSNNSSQTDTLKNISEPGVLLHRQKRVLEYNKDYMVGDKIDFQVVTKSVDSGKVFIDKSQSSGYRAVLVDTSVTSGGWTGLVYEFLGSQLIRCVVVEGETRRLGMVDAEDGVYEVWCDGIVGIAMETDNTKWLLEKDRKKVDIRLRSKGNVVIYSSRDKSQQLFPIPYGLMKFRKEGDAYIIKWQDYEDHFLKYDSIYATIEPGEYGEFEIVAQYKRTNQEHTKEKAIILGVPKIESIEFISDHTTSVGTNVLRIGAKNYISDGRVCLGPEWIPEKGINYPISHSAMKVVELKIDLKMPEVSRKYILTGHSVDPNLTFYCAINSNDVGLVRTPLLKSNEILSNYPEIIDSLTIEWAMFDDLTGKLLSTCRSSTRVYVLFNEPITKTTRGYDNYLTEKRIELLLNNIAGVVNKDEATLRLWDFLQTKYMNYFGGTNKVSLKELWLICDNKSKTENYRMGMCAEYAALLENMTRLCGIETYMKHLKPSATSIKISSLEHILPDTTRSMHPGDEYFMNNNGNVVSIQNAIEMLMFYFAFYANPGLEATAFQDAEGCLFFNNRMYSIYAQDIIGIGSDLISCARSVLEQLEEKNEIVNPIRKQLQRWAIKGMAQGNKIIRECILQEEVPIP